VHIPVGDALALGEPVGGAVVALEAQQPNTRIWRDMPKIVFSRILERADWNTIVVRAVVADEIMELKARPGGDLVLGGADLAAAFMRHDLIDEYRRRPVRRSP
jgi:dihydrofolate reductase